MSFFQNITGAPRVRAIMSACDVTNISIAEREKVSLVYVSNVVNFKRKGYRIRRAIAEECGVPYHEIWTDEDDQELPRAA